MSPYDTSIAAGRFKYAQLNLNVTRFTPSFIDRMEKASLKSVLIRDAQEFT